MCNLSQGIYNEGVHEGMDKGLSQRIEGAVDLLREAGLEDAVILKKIMVKYIFQPKQRRSMCTRSVKPGEN